MLGRDVAIKILREQYFNHEGFSSRFENEARAAALISHPNVVQVFDYGREEKTAYIVMQYVPGPNLKELVLEEGPLSIDEAVEYTRQILDGLAAIHDAGIIHRDVKPQNVLLTETGQVKVTDFGIARVGTAEAGLTEAGTALGTAAYMAPEQASGQDVTPASDLYSVGVILYELLTRRMPFPGENPVQVMYRHVNELPPPPRSINPRITPALEAVLLRALAKAPEDRFASARAMRDALAHPAAYVAPAATKPRSHDPSAATAVTPAVAAAVAGPRHGAAPRVTTEGMRSRRPAAPPLRAQKRRRNLGALIPLLVLALLVTVIGAIALANPGGDSDDPGAGAVSDATETPTTEASATVEGVVPVIEPTETEAPSPTAEPTATAEPTETPEPTPEPTQTPEPTATPEPEPEPTATPEPEPTEIVEEPVEPTPIANGQFNVPLQSLTIPGVVANGPHVNLSAEDFTGAYRRPDGQLYGRPATHVYGVGSNANAATATFTVDTAPQEYILVTVTGMDDERPVKVPMRLWLNDRLIWEGPSPFPNEQWLNISWLVSDLSALAPGENTITVEVTEGNGTIGQPPWILVTSATVYYG